MVLVSWFKILVDVVVEARRLERSMTARQATIAE